MSLKKIIRKAEKSLDRVGNKQGFLNPAAMTKGFAANFATAIKDPRAKSGNAFTRAQLLREMHTRNVEHDLLHGNRSKQEITQADEATRLAKTKTPEGKAQANIIRNKLGVYTQQDVAPDIIKGIFVGKTIGAGFSSGAFKSVPALISSVKSVRGNAGTVNQLQSQLDTGGQVETPGGTLDWNSIPSSDGPPVAGNNGTGGVLLIGALILAVKFLAFS